MLVVTSCGGGAIYERVDEDPNVTVAAGGGATSPGFASSNPVLAKVDPCALLTPDEAREALGAPVSAGVASLVDNAPICTFNALEIGHAGESVTVQVQDAKWFDQLKSGAPSSPVYKYMSIEGLGDAALVQRYNTAIGHDTTGDAVIVKTGKFTLVFGIVSLSMKHAKVIDAQKVLAQKALARLTP